MATPLSPRPGSPLLPVFAQAPALDEPASKLQSPGVYLPFETLRLVVTATQEGFQPPHLFRCQCANRLGDG